MIHTLRLQLLLATGSIAVVVMAVFLVALTLFGGPLISQPIVQSIANAASDVRMIAAAAPSNEPIDAVVRTIVALAEKRGVNVALIPPSENRNAPPQNSGPLDMPHLLGIRGETVALRDSLVLIVPRADRIDEAVRSYLVLVVGAGIVSLVLSFLVARWSSAKAVDPLLAVTGELERFAGGDLRRRVLLTRDRGEVGALTTAFNGAAEQVSKSLAERVRVEMLMRQFVADASHELRTPLTIIGGFIDVLQRGGSDDVDLLTNALNRMSAEQMRMRHLVDRLVLLAHMERPSAADPQLVDIVELSREMATTRSGDISVPVRSDHEFVYVRADPSDIYEAVGNVVENAVKYGRDPVVSIAAEGSTAVIRVVDNGPGIVSGDAEKIFERFYRSDAARAIMGSGLGLSIAVNAVTRAGGTLALEDARVGQTTFAIRLPLIHSGD
jgi:two-component system OmpR family sensor kinase